MVQKGQHWLPYDETVPQDMNGLIRRVQVYNNDIMCVENTFEAGTVVPSHAHPHSQVSYIVSGVFTFTVVGETRTVKSGDSILMNGNEEHACACLESGVVLDIFTPMREDFV